MNMTNNASLFIAVDGDLFQVTHICNSVDEANAIMREDNQGTAAISEDEQGRIFLALQTPQPDLPYITP